jgi:dTDP-4-dehydrorhamnose reductase
MACGTWLIHSAIAWVELARLAACIAGVDASRVEARPTRELGLAAPRPTYSVLGSERGMLLPSLDNAISRYFAERQQL